jgi:two-component system, NtrC family, response regulator AtoC
MNYSAELCKSFFNTAEDWIFVIDANTRTISEAGTRAIRDIGYSRDELLGLCVDGLLRQHNGAPMSFGDEGDRKPGIPRSPGLRLLKKDGETVFVDASVSWFKVNLTRYILLVACKAGEAGSVPGFEDPLSSETKDFPTIIGRSIKIRDVCRLIGSSAKSDVTVLIQGESGTGKEIVANALHAHSHRRRGPLVKVNCAALTETLLESELFGHVRGAFTGAIRDRSGRFKQADGGTIFLDEVGSMSLAGQAKLLRVMQEHNFEPVGSSVTIPVNVRVVTATNSDLAKAVSEDKFREDLYYRLNVFLISLPPLRERREDIALLAQHFLIQYSQAVGKKIHEFSPATLDVLFQHDWPGNVRELENAIEHAVIVENESVIQPSSLPMHVVKGREMKNGGQSSTAGGLREKLNAFEKQALIEALDRANWVKKRAAAMLGVDARNLPYLLRKHDLDRRDEGKHALYKLH